MKSIGGYFELELNVDYSTEYYKDLVRLNTARNALEYIIKVKKYKKVYIPFFTCDVVLEPFEKLGVPYEFYHINADLEPVFDFDRLDGAEAFLYTNYFGIKDAYIMKLSGFIQNLIIDNAQSFFSKPIDKVSTFYSPRKFFGLSDGAYVLCETKLELELEEDFSYERMSHLLIRADKNAEDGYAAFSYNDISLINQPIKKMSKLTHKLLCSVDYEETKRRRKENFTFLHKILKDKNLLKFEILEDSVPLVYPFWTENHNLRSSLIENKIYCATYWPNVIKWCSDSDVEVMLTNGIVHLPIDQRYSINDMRKILQYV